MKPVADTTRDETRPAQKQQEGSGRENLLEQVLSRENMAKAWKHVKANKGSAGVDGLSIEATFEYLKDHWPEIRSEIRDGTYRPKAVRRVEISKPTGGKRVLGVPTVIDRLIQQGLLQVLQPLIDPTFSEFSYGFRPGRSAHDAVLKAHQYVQEGYQIVVDIDLEKFFDTINHDILMDRLAKRIADKAVLRLIRRYLQAGIMTNGVVVEHSQGANQGGPLSPLLANVMLDEVDKELERRGHKFSRYGDDCNIYVRSQKAGERVLGSLRKLYTKLHLRVNEAIATFKRRIRLITRRVSGRSMAQVAKELRQYLPGWKAYFSLAQTPSIFRDLDSWIRRRLRAIQLKHWQRGPTMYHGLRRLGATHELAALAAGIGNRWWHCSRTGVQMVLTVKYFDSIGIPRLT